MSLLHDEKEGKRNRISPLGTSPICRLILQKFVQVCKTTGQVISRIVPFKHQWSLSEDSWAPQSWIVKIPVMQKLSFEAKCWLDLDTSTAWRWQSAIFLLEVSSFWLQSVDDFVRYMWNNNRIVKAAVEYSLPLFFLGLVAPAAEGTQQRTNRAGAVIDPTIPCRPGYQIDDANTERARGSNAPPDAEAVGDSLCNSARQY